MFGMSSIQELLMIIIIITVLSASGIWPMVVRGLRELRGEQVPDPPPSGGGAGDMDMSYRLLGLSSSASWDEIEKAYRRKAKVHHPDRGGDEDAMRALNHAYAQLKQVKKKR